MITYLDRDRFAAGLGDKVGHATPTERERLTRRDVGQDVVSGAAESRGGRL